MESSDDERDVDYVPKEISHRLGCSGPKFVDEVLNGQNESFLENFRMDKRVFYKLCDILQGKHLLCNSRRIKVDEQVAMFMFIIGHNLRLGAVQELFRHSKETISRYFNNVLNAIMSISLEFFQTPGPDVLPEISADPRFYPYFKDCVGAVDCIHIPVSVGVNEHEPFRNKNGLVSQIVLAACSFNLDFQYVLAGWEGSVSDMQVLNSALTRRNKLKMPEGRYYLVDSKYANMPGFISPYPGVPYHSKEFPSGNHPQNAKELFNQRHSLLLHTSGRRVFKALKMRFPILFSAPPYPLQTQVKLAVVICALHNFIRRENPDDWLSKMHEKDTIMEMEELFPASDMDPMVPSAFNIAFGTEELEFSSQLRDSIATEMWEDYIHDFSPI